MFVTSAFCGAATLYKGSAIYCYGWLFVTLIWLYSASCGLLQWIMGFERSPSFVNYVVMSIETCMGLGEYSIAKYSLAICPIVVCLVLLAILGLKTMPGLMSPWIFILSCASIGAISYTIFIIAEIFLSPFGLKLLVGGNSTICNLTDRGNVYHDGNYYRFSAIYGTIIFFLALLNVHGFVVLAAYQREMDEEAAAAKANDVEQALEANEGTIKPQGPRKHNKPPTARHIAAAIAVGLIK